MRVTKHEIGTWFTLAFNFLSYPEVIPGSFPRRFVSWIFYDSNHLSRRYFVFSASMY